MAGIPLGEFGFRAPQQPTGQTVNPAAFAGGGDGLRAVGQALESVADVLYKREATQYANSAIRAGKQGLDEWEARFRRQQGEFIEKAPRLPDGTIDLDGFEKGVLDDFEKYSGDILAQTRKGTKNRLALEVSERDLLDYKRVMRDRVFEQVGKQKQQIGVANLMESIDTDKAAPIDAAEKMKRIGLSLGVAVDRGLITIDKAQEMRTKVRSELEYAAMFDEIAATNSLSQAYELRGKFSRYNPLLSTPQNREMRQLVDERIRALDKETETSLKASEELVRKTLTDLRAANALTPEILKSYRNVLSADKYNEEMMRFERQQDRAAAGQDDAATLRQFKLDIRRAWKDPAKLAVLRDRVATAASGYDPISKKGGTPLLSQATETQLNSEIEGYLNSLRVESRVVTNERQSEADRKFKAVEAIVIQKIQVQKAAAGKDKTAVEQMEADILEDLIRNRADPEKWLEGLRKSRPSLFKPAIPAELRGSMPVDERGSPNFAQAKAQAYQELLRRKKQAGDNAKRIQNYENEYRQMFEKIEKFQREWNAAE
jgi:hypothetical protein